MNNTEGKCHFYAFATCRVGGIQFSPTFAQMSSLTQRFWKPLVKGRGHCDPMCTTLVNVKRELALISRPRPLDVTVTSDLVSTISQ